MQTYNDFLSSSEFRPHLDDVSFIRFLRVAAIVILVLSIGFSVRGNYKGLGEGNLEKLFFWRIVLSLAVPLTSSFLSMVTFAKINLKPVGRVAIGIIAVVLFYVSARWIYTGFVGAERAQVANLVQENPELIQAKRDLQNILDRQNAYGISQQERISLLAREKEQRAFITDLTKRLMVENRNAKSNLETAIGSEKELAVTLFAAAPEVCTAVLSSLLVFLYGAGCGVRRDKKEIAVTVPEARERVVYVPLPADRLGEMAANGSGVGQGQREIQAVVPQSGGNGASRAVANWQPF